MSALPTIALLGAPGTGAAALASDLQQRMAPDAARIVCHADPHEPLTATLTLLMGLDLPCPPDERPAQEAADQQLRAALDHTGVIYKVVYGLGDQRVANALIAIKNRATSAYPISATGHFYAKNETRDARLRAWNCEKCSDPACEHRLFTSLTNARSHSSV